MIEPREIERAADLLRAGDLVAFPTETVYGLGADANNAAAVEQLYAVKGRPAHHPLIVHLANADQLPQWARTIPEMAYRLAAQFWPGPLTLVLKRAPERGNAVAGGQDTIGVRVPAHPVARTLLAQFGGGIAAPSANRFGHLSATTAAHVRQEFGTSIGCVLDGGPSEAGIESTIIDVSGARPALLRPGHIAAAAIEQVLGVPLSTPPENAPRAPGMLAAHYMPHTPLTLIAADRLVEGVLSLVRQGQRVAVLARRLSPAAEEARLIWIAAPQNAQSYAHDLYANLRRLDASDCSAILVELPPQEPEWAAINDRLGRAAAGFR